MSHNYPLPKNPSIGSGSSSSATTNVSSAVSSCTSAAALVPSETDEKCRKAIGRLSENLYIVGNEPSLALYCLQEHVRKEVPNMIKQKVDFATQYRLLQGTCYDCDYSIGAVKSMSKSQEQFSSIQNHLKNALFLKQQLKYEENRRKAAVRGTRKK
ncbi:Protein MEF2BNB [Orchesella cincta]|uniref:Protein MEF2BNB n=1 Tax=Orchesella cincta TaxID=48709 RepID=A0A1D2MNW2_ORCCI|nr:Protein MEF2BNB [Orchesella cincta]